MDSKVIFITHPYYGINNPKNNLRIYKKNNNDKWYYIQCKNKEEYRKELKKYIFGFWKYGRDENKSYSSMLDYYMGGKKSKDIMERNKMRREEMAMTKSGKFILDKDVESMQRKWSNYIENSNIQLSVLSLNQDYVDENINIKDLQKEVTTKLLPNFFKYCGYENPKENLEWIVSLHCDRENNYHFHIAWIEKNKSYKLKNNKLDYKRELFVSENENNFIKRQVSLSIERNKLYRPALIKINEELEHLQKYFNPKDQNFTLRNLNDIELEEDIIKLGYLLSQVRETNRKYIKYNSLPKNEIGNEIRILTKNIKSKIFSNSSELEISKKMINDSIKKLNDILLDIDKRNNISNVGFESAFDNKLIKEKLEKSDNYILNAIVNNALYNYEINKKDNITLNDLINEISVVTYKKHYKKIYNTKKLKIKLLENHLKYGKNYNLYKISNALKRLSKESEKSAELFYEMLSECYEKDRDII